MNLLPNPQIDIDRYINNDDAQQRSWIGLIPEIQLNSTKGLSYFNSIFFFIFQVERKSS